MGVWYWPPPRHLPLAAGVPGAQHGDGEGLPPAEVGVHSAGREGCFPHCKDCKCQEIFPCRPCWPGEDGLYLDCEWKRGVQHEPATDYQRDCWQPTQDGKERLGKGSKRMGMEYILEAMQHHGLGHLPQPDNFTTCGRLGIEVNQYNNPIECYADETIDDMR